MKKIGLVALSILYLSVSSCTKKGCTDPAADNYNSEAIKDNSTCVYKNPTIPDSYEFTHVSGNSSVFFTPQLCRIAQLTELGDYMRTGSSGTVDASAMESMFVNAGGDGDGNFSFSSPVQLADNCYGPDVAMFSALFDSIALASVDFGTTASEGQAGILNSGSNSFLLSSQGIEYAEVIEIGLSGAVFMYQSMDVMLGSTGLSGNNSAVIGGEFYTELENNWDMAFGNFGADIDFPSELGDSKYWALVSNEVDGSVGSNTDIMDAFLRGRALISQDFDLTLLDAEILTIRTKWEKACAKAAIERFTTAKTFLGTDPGSALHYISQGYAYVWCLKYVPAQTRMITDSDHADLLAILGTNFWDIFFFDLDDIIDELEAIYSL